MELRQLKYFVGVSRHGSLTRAAAQLRISQPALTRQIRQLEREVGAALFERTPTGMAATAAGVSLFEHARSILGMVASARDVAARSAPVTESVELGLAPGLPGPWLSDRLAAVIDRVPQAQLVLVDADSTTQTAMLRTGRLDVALVHEQPPPALVGTRIRDEPYGVAVRPGTEPALTGPCPMAALDGRRVLVHARNQLAVGHDQLTTRAHERDIRPEWVFASYTEHAQQCADTAGADLAIITEHSAARLLPGWSWHPLVEPASLLETYAVRQRSTRAVVMRVHDVLCEPAGPP
jgi:DNA-binding transcriptional LysR family regulator